MGSGGKRMVLARYIRVAHLPMSRRGIVRLGCMIVP
jgi:hypothetical protein